MKIGIIGLGMMGRTHYEAYQNIDGAQVIAVADRNPKRASGDLSGTGGQGNPDEGSVLSLGEVQVYGKEVPRYQPLIETDLPAMPIRTP